MCRGISSLVVSTKFFPAVRLCKPVTKYGHTRNTSSCNVYDMVQLQYDNDGSARNSFPQLALSVKEAEVGMKCQRIYKRLKGHWRPTSSAAKYFRFVLCGSSCVMIHQTFVVIKKHSHICSITIYINISNFNTVTLKCLLSIQPKLSVVI